ncbi:MAG: hypothetical protein AB7I27_11560 [Bacteriovoracaceae bacterium]
MKTVIVPLVGDPSETLYHLGLKEKDSFRKLENRVTNLLSTNLILRQSKDIFSRAKSKINKARSTSFFDICLKAYCAGLGIEVARYKSFISLFEMAAHSGQIFPELKGLLPGCTSLFQKTENGLTHSRLIDFPLIGIFDATPRLYFWQFEGKQKILNFSCEGLAPLFFQSVHENGMSIALHHKPSKSIHEEGQSIFQITFDLLFDIQNLNEFKKELKKNISMTKWSYLLLDKEGQALSVDIDGPAIQTESFNLNETSPLIFTNIPIQKDSAGFESYLQFSLDRQIWLKEKLSKPQNQHPLDLMTDVGQQKTKAGPHPTGTLSTTGALHINLSKGLIDIKEGDGALVCSDPIVQFSLSHIHQSKVLKKGVEQTQFEKAWKRASLAQSAFDQNELDLAYHELQMAIILMPNKAWREIFSFYLCVWDYKFLSNNKELALVYKGLKKLNVPPSIKDQWLLLCMRFEKRLGLAYTVKSSDLSPHHQKLFDQETLASKPVFTAWMKLLYPRIEILDVLSPHDR